MSPSSVFTKDPTIAVAIFVKTPGLSPIKTRLAASIGQEQATQFYERSLNAVKSVAANLANGSLGRSFVFTPYWAVAEDSGLESSRWKDFQCLAQGEGGLGERLSRVYNSLLAKHPSVILIGADSPQITPSLFQRAAETIQSSRKYYSQFAIGHTHDGGFYLLGGSLKIPTEYWTRVPYSMPNTASELRKSFDGLGGFVELEKLIDVDTSEDLERLDFELMEVKVPTPEQKYLLDWITTYKRRVG